MCFLRCRRSSRPATPALLASAIPVVRSTLDHLWRETPENKALSHDITFDHLWGRGERSFPTASHAVLDLAIRSQRPRIACLDAALGGAAGEVAEWSNAPVC